MMSKLMQLLFLLMQFLVAFTVINASGESFKIVPANEILYDISKNKPIEYYDAKIVGNLDLSELSSPPMFIGRKPFKIYVSGWSENAKIITSKIHIERSTIDGFVNFNNTIFDKQVIFNNVTFNRHVDFKGSQFNNTASFYKSTFDSTASFKASKFYSVTNFKKCRFSNNADFGVSEFNGEVKFAEAKFNGFADFGGSSFERYADYSGSQFNENALFGGSKFNKSASFLESRFNGFTDFGGSQFDRSVNFGGCQFGNIAKFAGSKFNESAEFQESYFDRIAAFEKSKFNGHACFDSCRFNGDALFEDAVFNSLLSLNKTKYDKFYVSWDNIFKLAYDNTAYLLLIDNFKKIGFLKDADDCYLQYRIEYRNHPRPREFLQDQIQESGLMFIDTFFEISFGYGVRPLNPIGWSFVLILIFSIFWGIIRLIVPLDEYMLSGYISKRNWPTLIINSITFSAAIFLSGTKLFIDPPGIHKSPGLSGSFIKFLFISEQVLGALFSILFFLAISRTVLRL